MNFIQKALLRADSFVSKLQGFGGARDPVQQVQIERRAPMQEVQLDGFDRYRLMGRINAELPRDASSPVTIKTGDEALDKYIRDELKRLSAAALMGEGCTLARKYGGGALWVALEGGGDPDTEVTSLSRIVRLVPYGRFSLHPQGYLVSDPASPYYRTYELYNVERRSAGASANQASLIHASRMLRFYGDPVPERELDLYQGWGKPLAETVAESFLSYWLANKAGGAIASSYGAGQLLLPNLEDLLTRPDGMGDLLSLLSMQQTSMSAIRMMVLGPGMTYSKTDTPLGGWPEVHDRVAQHLAADIGYPVTKLFGQAPGGLSTDDASAERNWSRTVENFQTEHLLECYTQLVGLILRQSDSPARGRNIEFEIKFAPYSIPTRLEEAQELKATVDAITPLLDRGVIGVEEARSSLSGAPLLALSEEIEQLADPAPLPEDVAADPAQALLTQQAAGADVSAQDSALNGAQGAMMIEITASVWNGIISYSSGVAMMQRALLVDEETAKKLIGERPAAQPMAQPNQQAATPAPAPAPPEAP